jgi:uncharacterized repeat protein (TIGR03803 family)
MLFRRFATLLIGLATVILSSDVLATAQTETTIYSFKFSADGAQPVARLVRDKAGHLFGTSPWAGTTNSICNLGCGTVFELAPASGGAWTFSTIYSFTGGTDGYHPLSGLTLDANGNLYGTTYWGGTVNSACTPGCGTVFQLIKTGGGWKFRRIHSFSGADGAQPVGNLNQDKTGNIYGTTSTEGGGGGGTVFRLSPVDGGHWMFATLYAGFHGGNQGSNPHGGVIVDPKGNLYGTTNQSIPGFGTVYELSATSGDSWKFRVLHTFQGTSAGDGASPAGDLVRDKAGNFYGTTMSGGTGSGTVYKLTPSGSKWSEALLQTFSGIDGALPEDGLALDAAGNLYGTTAAGGTFCINCGTVFKLTLQGSAWNFSSLYNFSAADDGAQPVGGVIVDSMGNLYGTTSTLGYWGFGTVFEISQ